MTEPTLPPEPAKDATADELEADIAATREQLGETIDALEDKLNVSAQAKRKVDQYKIRVVGKVNSTVAQVTSKVNETKARVRDKVVHTKADVTGKRRVATSAPVFPDESTAPGAGAGSSGVSFAGHVMFTGADATRTEGGAGVPDKAKHISTGLADKFTAAFARTKTNGRDGNVAPGTHVGRDTVPPAAGRGGPDPAASTSPGAAPPTGKVGQTRANFSRAAGQVSGRARQNPRRVFFSLVAASAGVVTLWLAWRQTETAFRSDVR